MKNRKKEMDSGKLRIQDKRRKMHISFYPRKPIRTEVHEFIEDNDDPFVTLEVIDGQERVVYFIRTLKDAEAILIGAGTLVESVHTLSLELDARAEKKIDQKAREAAQRETELATGKLENRDTQPIFSPIFHGVAAPTWATNEGLSKVLRAEAEHQDSDRNRALLLTAAERIETLTKADTEICGIIRKSWMEAENDGPSCVREKGHDGLHHG